MSMVNGNINVKNMEQGIIVNMGNRKVAVKNVEQGIVNMGN